MKLGILTSVERRHEFFVRTLSRRFHIAAVGRERIGYSPAAILTPCLSETQQRTVRDHFEERDRQETRYFGSFDSPDERSMFVPPKCIDLQPETLNTVATAQFFQANGADVLVVFGTNLIREPLLSLYAGRMINMHLGLSPYYRGTATNFYPLLNDEPEFVGATIHLIDAGIDRGPIFRHARPIIVADDRPHTIGCKAILAGTEAMTEVLEAFQAGVAKPVPQWPVDHPRLYLRKDYHPRQVVELYDKLDAGLIPRYVERAERVANRVRLVRT